MFLVLGVERQTAAVRMFLSFFRLSILAFEVGDSWVGDSSWNFGRLTVPKNQKQIVSLASHKLFLWSVDAVIRQLEGPVVDRNAGLGAENFVGLERLLREPCAQAT